MGFKLSWASSLWAKVVGSILAYAHPLSYKTLPALPVSSRGVSRARGVSGLEGRGAEPVYVQRKEICLSLSPFEEEKVRSINGWREGKNVCVWHRSPARHFVFSLSPPKASL